MQGVVPGDIRVTCTACATTLLLEFGMLSRLSGHRAYEQYARNAAEQVFGVPYPPAECVAVHVCTELP